MPDRFGFVLWNGTATVPSGTFPAATTVTPGGVGVYQVDFVGQAAKGGVAHVTAINPAPHWCQIDGFGVSGADEVVVISCYKVGGAPDNSSFSAIFDSSSGAASSIGRFGYVDSQASGVLVSQYNSAGATNSVTHLAPGRWSVQFPNLGTPDSIDGSLQATAVSSASLPARCKVTSWTSSPTAQIAQISCYNAAGSPLDTQFTLTYQYLRSLYGGVAPPKYFGYLWNAPTGGPVGTNYNSITGPGGNTLTPGTLAIVDFPQLAVLPDDIQVTASGQSSDFCGLNIPWTHSGPDTIARDVNCFTNAGAPDASGFLISDNSAN